MLLLACAREACAKTFAPLMAPSHFCVRLPPKAVRPKAKAALFSGAVKRRKTRNYLRLLSVLRRFSRGGRRRFGSLDCAAGFLARGGEHHDHLPAFELGKLLDLDDIRQVFTNAVE